MPDGENGPSGRSKRGRPTIQAVANIERRRALTASASRNDWRARQARYLRELERRGEKNLASFHSGVPQATVREWIRLSDQFDRFADRECEARVAGLDHVRDVVYRAGLNGNLLAAAMILNNEHPHWSRDARAADATPSVEALRDALLQVQDVLIDYVEPPTNGGDILEADFTKE